MVNVVDVVSLWLLHHTWCFVFMLFSSFIYWFMKLLVAWLVAWRSGIALFVA